MELTCHLRAAGSGSPSHGPGPAFRRYGLKSQTLSAPGPDGLSLESDAFRCPHRLERLKRPKDMSGTHFENDSDQAGSQPRSSFIVHRSSSVRPFGAHPPDGVVLFKLSIVYRLSGWHPTLLRTLRSLRPRVSTYAPYGPGCLPTYQPHTRLPLISLISLLCNRLSTSTSTSTSTSVPAASPYQRSTGLS